jgi:hypothetical protein
VWRGAASDVIAEDCFDALRRKVAEAQRIARFRRDRRGAKRMIADRLQWLAHAHRQFIQREVGAALLEETERAVVGDEKTREKSFRRTERVARPTP